MSYVEPSRTRMPSVVVGDTLVRGEDFGGIAAADLRQLLVNRLH